MPFQSFEAAVTAEKAGFAGNKENLSRVFNAERIRLGQSFETELLKFIGDDAEKHFWISSFITARSYLHGNTPLPDLAFRIRTRALELLADSVDEKSLGRKVTIYRDLAVASKLAGKQDDATRFRDKAESILAGSTSLSAYVSGRTEFDICVYRNISGNIDACKEDGAPPEKIVSRGWLNSQALEMIKPIYPVELKGKRIKAQVDVGIMTDTSGNVISATVIRGPKEFHKAAVDAAMRTKFGPVTLSGQPVKTSGWLSFVFSPQ